jgi:CRISPR-associated RAMP protein
MSNSAKIIGRYTLTGTVKLISPLIIRAGVYNDILNDTVDDIVVTYHDGQPFIPGTSLAGVLRQTIQDIRPDVDKVLFGSIDEHKGTQSALQINDIPLENTNISVRDGICIDDVLGVTKDGAKYDFEVIESGAYGTLRIDCIIREYHQNQVDIIEEALKTLANLLGNGISIGARTVNGFGRIACEDISLEHYDFAKPESVQDWLLRKSGATITIPEAPIVAKRDLIIDMDCYLEDTILIKSIFEARWEDKLEGKSEDKLLTLFIPGTSVKGVLRHQCGHIVHALGRGTAITNELFGFSNDKTKDSHKSRVLVNEVYFDTAYTQEEQHRIRVDRFTGGVMNGALFADHPLRNTKGEKLTFPLHIRIKDCTDSEAGLAMLLVKDLMTGQVTMGANRTIGCGRIKGHSVTVKYNGESYVIDGTGKVTGGQVETLESLVQALHQSTDNMITAREGAHE